MNICIHNSITKQCTIKVRDYISNSIVNGNIEKIENRKHTFDESFFRRRRYIYRLNRKYRNMYDIHIMEIQ